MNSSVHIDFRNSFVKREILLSKHPNNDLCVRLGVSEVINIYYPPLPEPLANILNLARLLLVGRN